MQSKCSIKQRWADESLASVTSFIRAAKTTQKALCEMQLFWPRMFSFAEQILLGYPVSLPESSCKRVLFSIRIFFISQTFMYFLCWKRKIVLHNNWTQVATYPFPLSFISEWKLTGTRAFCCSVQMGDILRCLAAPYNIDILKIVWGRESTDRPGFLNQ